MAREIIFYSMVRGVATQETCVQALDFFPPDIDVAQVRFDNMLRWSVTYYFQEYLPDKNNGACHFGPLTHHRTFTILYMFQDSMSSPSPAHDEKGDTGVIGATGVGSRAEEAEIGTMPCLTGRLASSTTGGGEETERVAAKENEDTSEGLKKGKSIGQGIGYVSCVSVSMFSSWRPQRSLLASIFSGSHLLVCLAMRTL